MNTSNSTKHFRQLALLALAAGVASAHAANGVWAGAGADGNWYTTANWTGGVIPGVTDGTTVNTDTMLQANNPTQKILTVDLNRNLQNITFDTAAEVGGFTIGGLGAGLGNPLLLTSGGTAQITAAVTGQYEHIFNAPLLLEGNGGGYTFLNNAYSAINGSANGVTFILAGGITGVATAGNVTTLNLAGNSAGWDGVHLQSGNCVSGPVGDGPNGGQVSLVKSGVGTWALCATNTYTGATVVNGGLLDLNYRIGSLTSYAGALISPNTPLVFGGAGGTIREKIASNVTDTNAVASVTLNAGQNVMTIARTSGGSGYWNLGASITRNVGATLDVQKGGSGTYQVPAGVVNTIPLDSGGAAYLTAESFANWAGYNTTTTLNSGSYTSVSSTASTLATNAVIASGVTLTTLTASTNINTLYDNINQATAINLGGNTLTLGGALITYTVNTAGSTITNGTLKGPAGRDLVIFQNSPLPYTIGATIADNGSATALTKGATNLLILTGNNTYSGATYINAGSLQLGNGGTAGGLNSSSVVTNNGSLIFDWSGATTFANLINGIGSVTNAGSGAVTLTADCGYTGNTVINSGATLNLGNGGTSGSVSNSAAIINNGALNVNLNNTVNYSGAISGSGTLANQGPGTTLLNGTNTYGGNTLLQAGTLALGANASISNSTAIVISSGAKLNVSAKTNFTLNGSLLPNGQILAGTGTVNGSLTISGASVITAGTNGVYGTLTITSNLIVNGGTIFLDVSSSSKDQLLVGGNLNLAAGTLVANLPSGSLANGTYRLINYTNSLLGNAGNITVNFPGATQVASLGTNTPNWITLVVSSANPNNLVWQGADPTNPNWWDVSITENWLNNGALSAFSQHDNVLFDDTSSNPTVDLQQAVAPGTMTVNASQNNYTIQTSVAGKISGNATLVLSNANTTLTILTTNDYAGSTTIANASGIVQVGNGSTSGQLGSGSITNNGYLIYDSPDSQTVASSISGAGSLTIQVGRVQLTGNNTYSGGTTNYGGATLQLGLNGSSGSLGSGSVDNQGSLVIDRSDTPTFNNVISDVGSLTNLGSGTVTLGGANNYSGPTLLLNGTLELGNASALGAGFLTMNAGISAAGILELNGFNPTLASLAGANGSVLPQIQNNGGTGVSTLTVNSPVTANYYGLIVDNTGSGGKVALTQVGPSALNLYGANTYSGGTLVAGGNLGLNSVTAAGLGVITLSNGVISVNAAINNTISVLPFTTNTMNGYNGSLGSVLITNNYGVLNINPPGAGTFSVTASWPNFGGSIVLGTSDVGLRLLSPSTGAANAAWDFGTGYGLIYPRDGGMIDLGSLTGVSTTSLNGSSADGATIYRIGALNTSTVFSGSINDSLNGTVSVTCSLIKVGAGTLTLDGTLNYSGGTSVSNGVLAIASVNNPYAALDDCPAITVATNAVLDVSARYDGTLHLGEAKAQTLVCAGLIRGSLLTASSGATISTGGAIGTLSVTNIVDLEPGVTLSLKLNRTNSQTADQIAATNSITVNGGTLIVTNLGPDLVTGDVFPLFNQAIIGTGFTSISLPSSNGLNTIQYLYETNLAAAGSSPAGTIKVLQGASALASNPTNILYNVSGTILTLGWPADHLGWLVQSNSLNLAVPADWYDISNTAAGTNYSITINPAQANVFYRLRHP